MISAGTALRRELDIFFRNRSGWLVWCALRAVPHGAWGM